MKPMSISQVAQQFGVEPHTLRYYEKEGILHPERTANGIRVYTEETLGQLEIAMCLKSTGMPLKDIRRYFELAAQGEETQEERLRIFRQHRERVLEEIATLQKHLQKIDWKISLMQKKTEATGPEQAPK